MSSSSTMQDQILQARQSPAELEQLYRSKPDKFSQAFPAVASSYPDCPIVQVWKARLDAETETSSTTKPVGARWSTRDIVLTIGLIVAAGTCFKLGGPLDTVMSQRPWLPLGLGSIAFVVFFGVLRGCSAQTIAPLIGLVAAGTVYLGSLPNPQSDTSILAVAHFVVIYWSLIFVAHARGKWNQFSERMNYIKLNGELLIYGTVTGAGFMVLMGVTAGLFGILEIDLEAWIENVILYYGLMGVPLVAALLFTRMAGAGFRIAPMLAKVFTPLFLIMVLGFLGLMIVQQRSPYNDREFLLTFNVLLVVVLGLSVFTITERDGGDSIGMQDALNIALVSATLVVDLIALSAILFRLTEYGLSPNRVAVLGANLLIFGHLAGILYHYLRISKIAGSEPSHQLEQWITRFMPLYTAWALFVAITFPLLFNPA